MNSTRIIKLLLLLFINFAGLNLPAQHVWTWTHGDNTVYSNGSYGSKGVAAPSNQPGSRQRSTSWTDAAGNFWLFGGFGYATGGAAQTLNDLWKYDRASNQWTWMSGDNTNNTPGVYGVKGTASASNKPGARYGALSWPDGAGNLWLFGGYGYAETGVAQFLNDLWKYNPFADEWTWINGDKTVNMTGISGTMGMAATSNKPGSRYGGASWKDGRGNFWMFGGKGYSSSLAGDLNDLWMYNPVANEWTWVNGDNTVNNNGVYGTLGNASITNKPGSRYLSAYWTDNSGHLWLFGGEGYGNTGIKGNLNDLWMYDLAINAWTWKAGDNTINVTGSYGTKGVAAISNKPGARQGIAAWTDGAGSLWLFGGSIAVSQYLNDLWKYSPATNEWTWVSGDNITNRLGNYGVKGLASLSNMPGSRYVTASWKDDVGTFWLFGGEGYSASALGYLSDLWKVCVVTGSVTPATASICSGSTQTLTASGGTSYQWSLNGTPINAAMAATYSASAPGTYTVMVSNGTCSTAASNSSIISASPAPAGSISPATASICAGGTQTLTTFGGTSYQWALNGTPVNGATAATYSAGSPGTYTVTISNGTCSTAASNSSIISASPAPAGSISPGTASICAGGTQTLTTSGGTAYQWRLNGTPINGATVANYTANGPGTYSVTISNGACIAAASNAAIITTVLFTNGMRYPSVYVVKNVPYALTARDIGKQFKWDPATGLSDPASRTPQIITSTEREFRIYITTESGCITVDTLTVKPYENTEVLVPTGFTPNGDNTNDVLRPICINIPVITYFSVYNRWGQLIYKTEKLGEGWDGRVRGMPQSAGVYMWIFEGRDPAGTIFRAKGTSTLIR